MPAKAKAAAAVLLTAAIAAAFVWSLIQLRAGNESPTGELALYASLAAALIAGSCTLLYRHRRAARATAAGLVSLSPSFWTTAVAALITGAAAITTALAINAWNYLQSLNGP
jgi:hypothetical protein